MVVNLDREVCSREGVLSSRHFEKHHPERPNITWVRVIKTLKSFWRHVAQCASVSACVFVHRWTVIPISELLTYAKVTKFGNA